MGKRTVSVPMVFAQFRFALDIRVACRKYGVKYTDVDVLAGLGSGNTAAYANAKRRNPQMETFLGICNALDLDPRSYFLLAE